MKGKSSFSLLFITGSIAFSFLLASFSPTYYRSSAATTIEEARANTNVNLVSGGEISDNIRDSYDNGMSYSDGTSRFNSSGMIKMAKQSGEILINLILIKTYQTLCLI